MNKDCEIIKDLIPLYVDGVCSEESKAKVEVVFGGGYMVEERIGEDTP